MKGVVIYDEAIIFINAYEKNIIFCDSLFEFKRPKSK